MVLSGTPASFTTKTGRHDIAEILLKLALNTKNHYNIYLGPTVLYFFYFHFITEFKMVFITDFIQLTVIVIFLGVTTATSVQGNLNNWFE